MLAWRPVAGDTYEKSLRCDEFVCYHAVSVASAATVVDIVMAGHNILVMCCGERFRRLACMHNAQRIRFRLTYKIVASAKSTTESFVFAPYTLCQRRPEMCTTIRLNRWQAKSRKWKKNCVWNSILVSGNLENNSIRRMYCNEHDLLVDSVQMHAPNDGLDTPNEWNNSH